MLIKGNSYNTVPLFSLSNYNIDNYNKKYC